MGEESPRFDGVRILLVDDEPNLLRLVRRILRRRGADVESALNGAEALKRLVDFTPDLVLTDLKMPELDGVELMRRLRERGVDAPVIVLTGHGTMETAIEALRHGARDYLLKPCDLDELMLVFARELETYRLRHENARLRTELTSLSARRGRYESYGEMVGDSPPMRAVYEQIERLCAFDDVPVLVTGETGTGKELVARALHRHSRRADRPFIAINCAAVPSELQESQLFGHRRGAFTGAVEDHVGAFQAADGGTLLLDEVGEMRPEMQVKLLRVLEERAITPLGQHQPVPVDVRVVAATNRDLAAAVAEGAFRADLYNRIVGAVIELPPLRERVEDIPFLAAHVLETLAREYAVRPKRLTPAALQRLAEHSWPGNVRELQNVIRRAFVFTTGDLIDADDLSFGPSQTPTTPGEEGSSALGSGDSQFGLLERSERRLIQEALAASGGNKSRAADLLGIDRKRLYRKLARYGLS